MSLLAVENVEAGYGRILALHGIDLTVEVGEIVTLIGSNGAGKTTLLRTLSGLIRARTGRIVFAGQDMTREPTHRIVASRLLQVPEGRLVLKKMSVRENLLAGAHVRRDRKEVERDFVAMLELFPILRARVGQSAGTLSGGEQQMLAIARALMGGPRLLMLDEPSLGLSPVMVNRIFEIVADIRRRDVTILLVEQNARKALEISDRAYVIELGRIVASGPAAEIAADDAVVRAYLGA